MSSRTALLPWLLAIAVVARVLISAPLLDSLYHYSTPGGLALLKVHPASVALYLVATLIVIDSHVDSREARRVVQGSVVLLAAVVAIGLLALWSGSRSSLSFIVDAVAVAPVTAIALVTMTPAQRRRTAQLLTVALALNGVVVLAEFAADRHFFPYSYSEQTFRPTGLLGHPILCGLLSAGALPFVFTLFQRPASRVPLIAILLLACFASGSRLASLVAIAVLLSCLVHAVGERTRSSRPVPAHQGIAYAALLIATVPAMVSFFRGSAVGARLSSPLGSDESALARIRIYHAFDYLSGHEVLFGTSERKLQLLLRALDLSTIESPLVSGVLLLGAIGTALLFIGYVGLLAPLVSGGKFLSRLGVVAFVLVALANNSLTTKSPALVTIVVLAAGAISVRKLAEPEFESETGPPGFEPEREPYAAASRSSVRR